MVNLEKFFKKLSVFLEFFNFFQIIIIGGEKMEKVKYFFKMHTKESILGFCLLLCLIIIGGTCYRYAKEDDSSRYLADTVEFESPALKEISVFEEADEQQIREQVIEEETIKEVEEKIRVDIKGQVVNPGVYEACNEDRVIDIINYAGGLLDTADTSVNNLSRRVWDEMVIIIYSSEEVANFTATKEAESEELVNSEEVKDIILNDATLKVEDIVTNQDEYNSTINQDKATVSNNSTTSSRESEKDVSSVTTSKISINTASKTELMRLNGIGESKAEAIISYRKLNGNFQSIEDLMKVKGIGEKIFAKIKDNITL